MLLFLCANGINIKDLSSVLLFVRPLLKVRCSDSHVILLHIPLSIELPRSGCTPYNNILALKALCFPVGTVQLLHSTKVCVLLSECLWLSLIKFHFCNQPHARIEVSGSWDMGIAK